MSLFSNGVVASRRSMAVRKRPLPSSRNSLLFPRRRDDSPTKYYTTLASRNRVFRHGSGIDSQRTVSMPSVLDYFTFQRGKFYYNTSHRLCGPTDASSLLEDWEQEEKSTNSFSTINKRKGLHIYEQQKLKQMKEAQNRFLQALEEYIWIWQTIHAGNSNQSEREDARQGLENSSTTKISKPEESLLSLDEWNTTLNDFHHPSVVDVSWEQLARSEQAFVELCQSCEHHFRVLAYTPRGNSSDEDDNYDDENYSDGSNHRFNPNRSPPRPAGNDNHFMGYMISLFPFWERMRQERTLLVESLKPIQSSKGHKSTMSASGTEHSPEKLEPEQAKSGGGMFGWLPLVMGNSAASRPQPKDPEVPGSTSRAEYAVDLVRAHKDPTLAPRKAQYGKLVSHLYFQYPNPTDESLSNMEWYQRRADDINRIVQCLPNPNNMSKKVARLSVRAYLDCGSLQAVQQAEAFCKEYPVAQQHGLLWNVLVGYLQVTQTPAMTNQSKALSGATGDGFTGSENSAKSYNLDEAALATQLACNIVLDRKLKIPLKQWQSLAVIGFQCLCNAPPSTVDGYSQLVETLAERKFGKRGWQSLLNHDLTKPIPKDWENLLGPNDYKTLQILIQIFAKFPSGRRSNPNSGASGPNHLSAIRTDDEYIRIAQQLLEVSLQVYEIPELRDAIKRSTFNSILAALKHRQGQNMQTDTEQQEDFDYAMNKILDRMALSTSWYPNEDTWHLAFRLAKTGPQVDRVWLKYELFHGLTSRYTLSPLKAAKYTLNAWASSVFATRSRESSNIGAEHPVQTERAWQIFQFLIQYSQPHLYADRPDLVRHLYNPSVAPDAIVYTLMWKICSRCKDWDTALRVYEVSKQQRRRELMETHQSHPPNARPLTFASTTYTSFLRCLQYCSDETLRHNLAQELYEDALENDKVGRSFQALLQVVHPALYEQEKAQHTEGSDDILEEDDDEEIYNKKDI